MARLKFLFLYGAAWIVFFQLARLLFLLYHFGQTAQLTFFEIAGAFFNGLRMDASMSAYLLLPVCLLVLLSIFIPTLKKAVAYKIYTAVVIFFLLLIITADLETYKQWGFRIDATFLKYLSSPAEAFASVSHLPLYWFLVFFLLYYFLVSYFFLKFISQIIVFNQSKNTPFLHVFIVLLFSGLLVIPMRGGLQQTPMNQSGVYFSTSSFANHAAINASWNFMQALFSFKATAFNPYHYMPAQKAKRVVDSLYRATGNSNSVLNTTKPNVILIIWESFTKKALSLSVDGKEVTPNFNKLMAEGLYFSNVYASGDRTDKGLAAIISGYPALPSSSVLRDVNKAAKLPYINQSFKKGGYATPFYYGGEPEFANIKSYLLNGGFYPIIEKADFAKKDQNSKWGAHDGVVANRIKENLQQIKQPFMVTWLTLTSHEPFETPVPAPFNTTNTTTQFLASLHYTDAVLNEFVLFCKTQPWWSNTLLIIIADHGHVLPETGRKEDNFKIPMLWLGGALKQPGSNNKIISQLDVATTLSAQVNGTTVFPFSKNVFDSSQKSWAFFSFNNGWGFVQPAKTVVFDNVGKQIIEQSGAVLPKDVESGKALQQVTYQNFLEK